jgi:hypothetical protein
MENQEDRRELVRVAEAAAFLILSFLALGRL